MIGYTISTLEVICAGCAYNTYFAHEIAQMARENAPVQADDTCGTCGKTLAEATPLNQVIAQAQRDATAFVQSMRG